MMNTLCFFFIFCIVPVQEDHKDFPGDAAAEWWRLAPDGGGELQIMETRSLFRGAKSVEKNMLNVWRTD